MPATFMPVAEGLLTGLTLIVAIGAQNAYLLRLGITDRATVVAPAVAICAGSDAVLILVGVLGVGAVVQDHPGALLPIRLLGAAFLLAYAAAAARRAWRPTGMEVTGGEDCAPGRGTARTLLTVLALTWLNPHVYLDTLVLLGGLANAQEANRWWWAAGAAGASLIWFTGLGFGARLLRPVFARPAAWRVLDVLVALVMAGIGVRLAVGL